MVAQVGVAVAFLASEDARRVTGQSIGADGGIRYDPLDQALAIAWDRNDAWLEMSGAKSYEPFLHVERAEFARLTPWDYTYFCWGFVDANLRVREVGVYTPGATDRGGLRQTLSIVGKEGLRDETESGYFFLGAFDVVGPFFIGASY